MVRPLPNPPHQRPSATAFPLRGFSTASTFCTRSSFPASKTARLQVTADHDPRHVSTEGTKTLSSPPEPLAGRQLIAALNIQTDLNTLESKLCGSVNKHKIMWLFEQASLFPALNEKAEKNQYANSSGLTQCEPVWPSGKVL